MGVIKQGNLVVVNEGNFIKDLDRGGLFNYVLPYDYEAEDMGRTLLKVIYKLGGTELFTTHGTPRFIYIGSVNLLSTSTHILPKFVCDYNGNKEFQNLVSSVFNYLYGTKGNLSYICQPYTGERGYPSYGISDRIYPKIYELAEMDSEDLRLFMKLQ